jgi:hypothetical protein
LQLLLLAAMPQNSCTKTDLRTNGAYKRTLQLVSNQELVLRSLPQELRQLLPHKALLLLSPLKHASMAAVMQLQQTPEATNPSCHLLSGDRLDHPTGQQSCLHQLRRQCNCFGCCC